MAEAHTTDADFYRGRDLGIEMLRASEGLFNSGCVEPRRLHRRGAIQCRVAKDYLARLIDEPQLLEGFAAVLSARIGTEEAINATSFDLPRAEFEGGEPGADGTDPGEGVVATDVQPQPADLIGDAICHVREAAAVIATAAERHCSAVIDGLDDLVGLAVKAVEAAEDDDARDRMEFASAQLEQAIAVLDLVNDDRIDDMLLYASGSLLAMSKRSVDARIEAQHG